MATPLSPSAGFLASAYQGGRGARRERDIDRRRQDTHFFEGLDQRERLTYAGFEQERAMQAERINAATEQNEANRTAAWDRMEKGDELARDQVRTTDKRIRELADLGYEKTAERDKQHLADAISLKKSDGILASIKRSQGGMAGLRAALTKAGKEIHPTDMQVLEKETAKWRARVADGVLSDEQMARQGQELQDKYTEAYQNASPIKTLEERSREHIIETPGMIKTENPDGSWDVRPIAYPTTKEGVEAARASSRELTDVDRGKLQIQAQEMARESTFNREKLRLEYSKLTIKGVAGETRAFTDDEIEAKLGPARTAADIYTEWTNALSPTGLSLEDMATADQFVAGWERDNAPPAPPPPAAAPAADVPDPFAIEPKSRAGKVADLVISPEARGNLEGAFDKYTEAVGSKEFAATVPGLTGPIAAGTAALRAVADYARGKPWGKRYGLGGSSGPEPGAINLEAEKAKMTPAMQAVYAASQAGASNTVLKAMLAKLPPAERLALKAIVNTEKANASR